MDAVYHWTVRYQDNKSVDPIEMVHDKILEVVNGTAIATTHLLHSWVVSNIHHPSIKSNTPVVMHSQLGSMILVVLVRIVSLLLQIHYHHYY